MNTNAAENHSFANPMLLTEASSIVAAQARIRPMTGAEIAELLSATYAALSALGAPGPSLDEVADAALAAADAAVSDIVVADAAVAADKPVPAVAIEDSVRHDAIICLEDGKELKLLKRYLMAQHGLTVEEYKAKWGLPADYPTICAEYAEQKSAYAKARGLGKHERHRVAA